MWASDLGTVVLMFVVLGGVSVTVAAAVYLEDQLDSRLARTVRPIGRQPVTLDADTQVPDLSVQHPMGRLCTHVGGGRHVSRRHCRAERRGPDRVRRRPAHLAAATPLPISRSTTQSRPCVHAYSTAVLLPFTLVLWRIMTTYAMPSKTTTNPATLQPPGRPALPRQRAG